MNLLNGFDSVWAPVSWCFTIDSHRSCRLTEVVNTGVDTNLVHNSDAGLLALLIKLHHSRANIASCDNVLLSADSGLDDHGVESWFYWYVTVCAAASLLVYWRMPDTRHTSRISPS